MIASLSGTVIDIGLDYAVIECGGVGYLFFASAGTVGALRRGEKHRVLTVMVVREDAITLYGFESSAQRDMFGLLQTVKGLGAKTALAALGALTPEQIATAAKTNTPKTLQKIPGIGPKVANRMCLELKDKVDGFAVSETLGTESADAQSQHPAADDVVSALVNMGIQKTQAESVVHQVASASPDLDMKDLLKASLKAL